MGTGTLFIVGTPLGNLGDITFRAVETLRQVSIVAAEDTRRTKLLLNRYGIDKPMVSLHEHNEMQRSSELIRRLKAGESVALLTDAGMPGISDPGAYLIEQAHGAGIPVKVVPGPSAVTAALALSGFPGNRFRFEGFPPKKQKALEEWLRRIGEESARDPAPVIAFESPYRLAKTLRAILEILGDIPVVVAREMTKFHEEVTRGSTSDLLARYTKRPPKGEVTLVFWPGKPKVPAPLDRGLTGPGRPDPLR